jgi:hypothetical protein
MEKYKLIFAAVACVLIASCDQRRDSNIGDAELQYFGQVNGIFQPLEARFEHMKALLGHADPTNPNWLDGLAKDVDEVDGSAARLSQLQPPDSLKDYHQQVLLVATELEHAAENLRDSIKYIRSGDTKTAVSAIRQAGTAMVAIGKIVTELTERMQKTANGATDLQ